MSEAKWDGNWAKMRVGQIWSNTSGSKYEVIRLEPGASVTVTYLEVAWGERIYSIADGDDARWVPNWTLIADVPAPQEQVPSDWRCSGPGCQKRIKSGAYCSRSCDVAHVAQIERLSPPLQQKHPSPYQYGTCKMAGCRSARPYGRGLCDFHDAEMRMAIPRVFIETPRPSRLVGTAGDPIRAMLESAPAVGLTERRRR